jgi:hypothetical protein
VHHHHHHQEMSNDAPPSTESFKDAVKVYIQLHDEIAKSSKQLREIRKQKDAVGETILAWMRGNAVDECELPDGKLVRKTSKRTETLKKEIVLDELKNVIGDEAKAVACLQNIFSRRGVVEREVLSRTVHRNTL